MDHSQTSLTGERWFAEVLDMKTDTRVAKEGADSGKGESKGSVSTS